jgi:hypothetical protein
MEMTRYDRDTQIISSSVRPFVSGKGKSDGVYRPFNLRSTKENTGAVLPNGEGKEPFYVPPSTK